MVDLASNFFHHQVRTNNPPSDRHSLGRIAWIPLEHSYILSFDNQVACMTVLIAEGICSHMIHPAHICPNTRVTFFIRSHTGIPLKIVVNLNLPTTSLPASTKGTFHLLLNILLPLLKAAAQPNCETSTPPPFLIKGWWRRGWGWTWTIEILVCFQLCLSGMNFTNFLFEGGWSKQFDLLLRQPH